MTDLATRFSGNPLIRPSDVKPSSPDMRVKCLLNPGVFMHNGKICLLVRVAERPPQPEGRVLIPFLKDGKLEILDVSADDPELELTDPRQFTYCNEGYLSTISHLRLFSSEDGIHFDDTKIILKGDGDLETYGIEDCRVSTLHDGRFLMTYTAVSANGYGGGLRITRNWRDFDSYGMILPPPNKDIAIFEETIGGRYYCLHRPSGMIVGGHYIWLGSSPDLRHWGVNRCIARTRPGAWDSSRIGTGAAPIRTKHGWLVIYHGADDNSRYCLGALLLDLEEPWKVLARSENPIMEPLADYEQTGFFGNVVFTNGHLVDGDRITIYYGAADSVICAAHFSIDQILQTLNRRNYTGCAALPDAVVLQKSGQNASLGIAS